MTVAEKPIDEIDLDGLEGVELEYLTIKQRDRIDISNFAWPDAPGHPKYPINTQAHLDAAAKLIGRAPANKQATIKARAIRIARKNNLSLPDSWKSSKESDEESNEDEENQRSAKESIDTPAASAVNAEPSTKTKIATIKTCWLEDGAVSLNNRIYPREAVDQLIQSAQVALSDPSAPPLTCYISHDKADADESTKIAGRVTGIWREGNKAYASIDIPDTHAGRDVATLIKNNYLNTMSLRASGAELRVDKHSGMPMVGGSNLKLQGIDYTSNPGIQSARIQQILMESADRPGICEIFRMPPDTILIEEVSSMKEVKETSAIPSMTSGNTVGMTSDPTTDDYAKRNYEIPPLMSNDDATGPDARGLMQEAHDRIAMVQSRSCAPSMESAYGKRLMQEAGKMISGKNDKHLDVAHDNLAKALGKACEGANSKSLKTIDPDDDGDAELAGYDRDNDMESRRTKMEQKEATKDVAKESAQITPEHAVKLLQEAGWKLERPKTQAELLQERIDAQKAAMEAQLAEQRKAMEAQMAEQIEAQKKAMEAQMAEMAAKFTATQQETPQRRSLVEGATVKQEQRPRVYKHGDYLKEQIQQTDFARLADRSYPLPEHINVERLIEEMKLPLLGMYDQRYGLGV